MAVSTSSKFSRWKYPWPRTWASTVFKSHHTQINSLLWAHHAGSRRAATIAHSVGLSETTIKAFPAAISDPGRQLKPLKDWLEIYKEFDNWTRLSACLSLCSYFESYLSNVITLAIESDPGIFLGKPHSVDGVLYLKQDKDFPLDLNQLTQLITKGSWEQRNKGFERLFGSSPTILTSSIHELDQMRLLRNKVGHYFGRSIENMKEEPLAGLIQSERLSAKRLKTWLSIVEKVVTDIDRQLRDSHIGAYEPLRRCKREKDDMFNKQTISKRISKYFPATHGNQLGKKYCADLIDYYNNLK